MMELLNKQYSIDLSLLDGEIENLYEANRSIISDELFSTRETALKADLENYDSNILKTKEKKFIRDKLFYDNSQAYNWGSATKTWRRYQNNKKRNANESSNGQNGSDSRASSVSSMQAPDHPPITKTHVF